MRTLWLHPRPPESQTLGLGPNKWCFRRPSRDSQVQMSVRRAPPQGLLMPLSARFPRMVGGLTHHAAVHLGLLVTLIVVPSATQKLSLLTALCQLHT